MNIVIDVLDEDVISGRITDENLKLVVVVMIAVIDPQSASRSDIALIRSANATMESSSVNVLGD